jgi:hypothetical protein
MATVKSSVQHLLSDTNFVDPEELAVTLEGYSLVDHDHGDEYLTADDLATFLAGEGLDHFTTDVELAAVLADYSLDTHNHDAAYSAIDHDHAAAYSAIDHDHTGVYATAAHNHDAAYSAITHDHDTTYLAIGAPPVLTGTGTVFDDLMVQMTQGLQGANAKPDFDNTNVGLLFPNNNSTERVYLNVQLPHNWKEGSTIYPHVHWHQSAATTPVFQMDYRWANIGAAAGSWTTAYTMSTKAATYTSGTIHQISSNAAGIDGTGKTMSSILQIKLYRNDSAYQGDCLVTSFDIHYEIDSLGSNTEYGK